jgi:bla regulator protein blaR1
MKLAAAAVAFAFSAATSLHGQLLHSDGPLPTFEVATIRPYNVTQPLPPPPPPPADGAIIGTRPSLPDKVALGRGGPQTTDLVQMVVTAQQLIASAFNLPLGFEGRIEGGPDWVRDGSHRYEIRARIDDATFAAIQKLSPERQRDQVQLMEQSLLADRFHLKVHFETRSLPAYTLVIAKGGPRLTPARAGETTRLSMHDNTMTATAMKLDQWILAPFLSGRTIVNQTGLTGIYDITLTWSERPELGNAPDLSTAVQQQLGLKLVRTKAPVEIIVIDSIDRPSEN